MFEKVNPKHPDKVADRIAGAIVDHVYDIYDNPRIAVEVLLGHGKCYIITEGVLPYVDEVEDIVYRIAGKNVEPVLMFNIQDEKLRKNQKDKLRCGDNGIFKGCPITYEQNKLTDLAGDLYDKYESDGKYIINNKNLIICQSNADSDELLRRCGNNAHVNPLGEWTGGTDVDCGATNRKLGSDMGDAVTGGGLHGKDLSKADVSVNIYCHLLAQTRQLPIEMCCAIGDEYVNGKPFSEIVEIARNYIDSIGGFEKFAEWGLIRPTKIL